MRIRLLLAVTGCAVLSACSLAPAYKVPKTPSVSTYKEDGIWTVGTLRDIFPRGSGWQLYGDTTLNGLEGHIEDADPTLVKVVARYDVALGYLSQAQSSLLPDVGAHADTDRQSANRPLRQALGSSTGSAAGQLQEIPGIAASTL